MEWSETVGKAAILAKPIPQITFAELNSLIPRYCEPEDIENLFAALSARAFGLSMINAAGPRVAGQVGKQLRDASCAQNAT